MTGKKKFTKEQHRAARPKQNPNNKEQASGTKKKRWKKHHKKPKKNLGKSLQELQAYINSRYHSH